ncbi:RrF2 family transcriptional regulator [Sporolactobacillus putidus]|uniref:Rrf2 family transcriptional regulator n=1 Tax=Sporolactobacillus putidus TaxID=492735 RepID=A0A917S6W3_9BACL|nr:Rrf2 family transcriptional regulator [Sporolactobacillus putidus]GGL61950.1 Rrf2 family transcriptional regulator [Sporolactobacillus putidus]
MNFSIGVEYALHCLVYLVDVPFGKSIGIKDLAKYQGVSETYLSKIFTKLKKAGIVSSTPGVKGGYELSRKPEMINFWEVVRAIEGDIDFFQCKEIRQRCILYQGEAVPDWVTQNSCIIKCVMSEAEQKMQDFLQSKSLLWLYEMLNDKMSEVQQRAKRDWFKNALSDH